MNLLFYRLSGSMLFTDWLAVGVMNISQLTLALNKSLKGCFQLFNLSKIKYKAAKMRWTIIKALDEL